MSDKAGGSQHREALLPRTSKEEDCSSSSRPSPSAAQPAHPATLSAALPNSLSSTSAVGRLSPTELPPAGAVAWAGGSSPPLLAPLPQYPPDPTAQPRLSPRLQLAPISPSSSTTAAAAAAASSGGAAGVQPAPAGPGSPTAAAVKGAPVAVHPLASASGASFSRAASCGAGGGGGGPSDAGGGFAPECRICLLADPCNDLVVPCHCTGTMLYAHLGCLRTWVREKRSITCELCGTMYREPYGSELAAAIPPLPPPPAVGMPRRITTPDGQPIIIMPVGVGLGPGAMGPLLGGGGGGQGSGGGAAMMAADPRDLQPQPLCEWRNMWSYLLILLLLLFAIIYVTVISKRGKQEPWMMTLWQVLLVVLPIYLVLRVAFDLYRHRLAQQLAAANMQAVAIANAAAAAEAGQHGGAGGQHREVIITRAGNRVLVLQRAAP